ncbi:aminotransferase class I and II protein [Ceratobasidium sp. AG-Ba]|nr:aminotransferase class I and II protein [Ceratobasidium sp. AG-Ba]
MWRSALAARCVYGCRYGDLLQPRNDSSDARNRHRSSSRLDRKRIRSNNRPTELIITPRTKAIVLVTPNNPASARPSNPLLPTHPAIDGICPARPLQLALAPILPSLRSDLADQAKELETRHAVFKQTLAGSGWEIGSAGAYFALVKHPFKGVRATEVCKRLAEEDGVVLLPLSFFAPADDSAWDSWMRVSVANVGAEAVREAAVRMVESDKRAHEWKPI